MDSSLARPCRTPLRTLGLFTATIPFWLVAAPLQPAVEIEETVYTYANANNGAGPMWCSGSTCLVRTGGRVFVTGLETLPDLPPLNNCRWVLFERTAAGWQKLHLDSGHTREPSPLAAFADGRIFVSANPTLAAGPEPGGGPARPDILEFRPADNRLASRSLNPVWEGTPAFTEHSYRSLAADTQAGELVLFQNIGYTHAEWTFLDRDGRWQANGKLRWPWGADYEKPQPIRICYPNVALRDRAVHFVGVSDIIEPKAAWREFKRDLTGREWDYDFRRLFYTWTPDLTREPFRDWIEIASRESTCGWVSPGDLWLSPNGEVHLLWTERAIDERLRARFFPEARQRHSLEYAVVRDGKILRRRTLVESSEEKPGPVASAARFHTTPEGRLLVCYYLAGRDSDRGVLSENRLLELPPDGSPLRPVTLPLKQPFSSFFTATVRAGSPPSNTLDLLGTQVGQPNAIGYARIRLE